MSIYLRTVAICSIRQLPCNIVTQDEYMTPHQLSLAHSLLYSLLADVRREAVPLVDAFDVPDEILNSALGRYDGDVYTHLYRWAQRAPRNKKKVQCMA